MAVKPAKATTQPDLVAQSATSLLAEINLEEAIADQLLDDIDWQKVRAAMLTKVKHRFFAWLISSNDTPVNLSPYPELAALPDADEEEKAA